MTCLGFKGGIGTSSRIVPSGHTVGVVLLCNFGDRSRLRVDGVPVGALLPLDPFAAPPPAGSCLGVVVTDAPLLPDDCERLARRIGLGLARTGSTADHGSGEIFLGLSVGMRADRSGRFDAEPVRARSLDDLFIATVDAAEEAVLNAMLMSTTVVGRGGHSREGLPADEVRRLLVEHGRG